MLLKNEKLNNYEKLIMKWYISLYMYLSCILLLTNIGLILYNNTIGIVILCVLITLWIFVSIFVLFKHCNELQNQELEARQALQTRQNQERPVIIEILPEYSTRPPSYKSLNLI